MSLHVAETLCQHLSLLDSETKKKKRKRNREYGTDEVYKKEEQKRQEEG